MEINEYAKISNRKSPEKRHDVEIEKKVDKPSAYVGEKLHYTSIITCRGKCDKKKLVFKDVLSKGLCFVDGSVCINRKRRVKSNPEKGIKIQELKRVADYFRGVLHFY